MVAETEMTFVGRYCLYTPIASGGAATIHLGCLRSDAGFTRPVAIKRVHGHHSMDGRMREELLTEARLISRIRHANVGSVLDVVSDGDDHLVVLEYVHGESLSQLLRAAADAVPVPIAVRIAIDVLEGLHAAHEAVTERGVALLVVHRDVSPQNVMVDLEGRARVVDFGLAKALERPYTTESGQFRGKLAYAAPEQVRGDKIDRRADIWAVGIVLWELLTGRQYFEGVEPLEIVDRLTSGVESRRAPSAISPACPEALDAIVLRALEHNRDLRPTSAREMALLLEKTGLAGSHRDVGRWVSRHAKAKLTQRSRLIDQMVAELRSVPAQQASETAKSDARKRMPPATQRRALGVLAVIGAAVSAIGAGASVVALAPRAHEHETLTPAKSPSALPSVAPDDVAPRHDVHTTPAPVLPDEAKSSPSASPPHSSSRRSRAPSSKTPAPIPYAPRGTTSADPLEMDQRN